MKQIMNKKRNTALVCVLVLLLTLLNLPLSVLANERDAVSGDEIYISDITVDSIRDGVAPWDADNAPGNDANENNRIVRSFDSVDYSFTVKMDTYESSAMYGEARVKLEFVLPLTEKQAGFDQQAMAWIDQTAGYAPVLTNEMREIGGVSTACQVLTCYKHLTPSGNNVTVVPGEFGENVVIAVKAMTNGEVFAPIISAAMEFNTWDGACSTAGHGVEKKTAVADPVTVSAAPKYNVQVGGYSDYKQDFDFTTGNSNAANQEWGNTVAGRMNALGITLQFYNDNASKGYKGIELPQGPITFDLLLTSQYHINLPAPGYTAGQIVNVTNDFPLLLWSCDANTPTGYGQANASDGRELYHTWGAVIDRAPYGMASHAAADLSCYNSGTWSATQNGNRITVTVSDYEINMEKLPTKNGNNMDTLYGEKKGIGCFAAGELWVVQPFNTKGSNITDPTAYEVVTTYGQGRFNETFQCVNLSATSEGGQSFADSANTNDAQMNQNDDRVVNSVELNLPGTISNRIGYAKKGSNGNLGVGVVSGRDGKDFAAIGTELELVGGFSHKSGGEAKNGMYFGTNLAKFYAEAFTVTGASWDKSDDATVNYTYLYATKIDGTDWVSDDEMEQTYENELKFYKTLSEIPTGHKCVGVLNIFTGPAALDTRSVYFRGMTPLKVNVDMSITNKTYQTVSTSRVWTQEAFYAMTGAGQSLASDAEAFKNGMVNDPATTYATLQQGVTVAAIDGNAEPNTGYLVNANIGTSTWYVKAQYDSNGVVMDHNSDWMHWGDTLIVVAYQSKVTKKVSQTNEHHAEKAVYNLDADQSVVDFELHPSVEFDSLGYVPSVGNDVYTTVTVEDTLPQYLTYIEDSAYCGGTYQQTDPAGGTQGIVTGGTLSAPAVTLNADGTSTLVWVFDNVKVGASLPTIYYSTRIGSRNPKEDIPVGTTHHVNAVSVFATHDRRERTVANGNYAEAGIAIARGSASSFGKYAVQTLVEPDGVIDYVVYFNNNAHAHTDVLILDTMPYHGANGSAFTGSYTISQWLLDPAECDVSHLAVYYTMDEQYKASTVQSLGGNDAAKLVISGWNRAVIQADGTVPELMGIRPVAWAIVGTLFDGEKAHVDLQIKLNPAASNATQQIENNCYVNVLSNNRSDMKTKTEVVNRVIEGIAWEDSNRNGVQDESAPLTGVTVTLLKLKDGGNPETAADYEPYHYQNNPQKPTVAVESGNKISVLADSSAAVAPYVAGAYCFEDLPAGTFAVKFETAQYQYASPNNGTTDDTKDSDAVAAYAADGSLHYTMIGNLSLPQADILQAGSRYVLSNNDSGFYGKIMPPSTTTGTETTTTVTSTTATTNTTVVTGSGTSTTTTTSSSFANTTTTPSSFTDTTVTTEEVIPSITTTTTVSSQETPPEDSPNTGVMSFAWVGMVVAIGALCVAVLSQCLAKQTDVKK